jgi:F-type H+-transporting ATPase subunit b
MGDILSQLAHLFLQTIPTVIFLFLLYVILDRFFFRPLTAVLKEREEETTGAMARSREQTAEAEEKAGQYKAAFQAARQEVYRQREADRRDILEDREATLKWADQQSEALLSEARAGIAAEVAHSKQELQSACQSLGQEIAETILGGAARGGERGSQP